MSPLASTLSVVLLLSLLAPTSGQLSQSAPPPNVLLVIADDVGVDLVAAYGEHPDPGRTPVIDSLAAHGMLFRNAWANPLCSSTRAALLTGRATFRTGVGQAIVYAQDTVELGVTEVSLPQAVSPVYSSAIAGKWHLSARLVSGLTHPLQLGFQHHWGHIEVIPGLVGNGYSAFTKSIDGLEVQVQTYATTDTVDDALTLMGQLPEPWMLWVAFNAPHSPFHKPPANLHSYNLPASVMDNIPIHTKAALEALDTELGRMLNSMDPAQRDRTIVVFLGDNGTDAMATTAPFLPSHAKKSVFEGGLNVPFIVAGPGVAAGTECKGLVNVTDVAATVAELAGLSMPSAVDSVSLVPYFSNPALPSLRDWVYSEFFEPNGLDQPFRWRRAVRGPRYKLIWTYDASVTPAVSRALFDLRRDPFELTDMLNAPLPAVAAVAFQQLSAVLDGLQPANDLVWRNLGFGLAGASGLPFLTGAGSLLALELYGVTLTNARPSAPLALVVGASAGYAPFMGGRMVPAPDQILFGASDGNGGVSASALWPPGLPVGLTVYFQSWILDPTGPFGFSASNAISGTTP